MKISVIGNGVVGSAVGRMFNGEVVFENTHVDWSFICVPTPSKEDGSCDTSIVEEVISESRADNIVIKSTVSPGTTDYLSNKYNKRIAFSPEYIGESKYYNPYFNNSMKECPFVIIGGEKNLCNDYIDLVQPILGPTKKYFKTEAKNAEVIKYMENSFFAAKIAFVNQMYDVCEHLGADWHDVREGWLLDPRINSMHTSVFKNKRGFSGKCLPKDLKAIIASVKGLYDPKLLEAVDTYNEDLNKRT